MTLLNTGQGTLFPCGKHVVRTTPKGRKVYKPTMPVPDMPTILRLYALKAHVIAV